jgi:hypothetical protein
MEDCWLSEKNEITPIPHSNSYRGGVMNCKSNISPSLRSRDGEKGGEYKRIKLNKSKI